MTGGTRFLAFSAAILVALSVAAYLLTPRAPDEGKTRIVWVSDNNPARQEQIAAFNAAHPDLELVLDYGNISTQKILLQSASGVGPDVFDIYGAELLQTYVAAGIVWDVTEEAKRMGFAADADTWPAAENEISIFGHQYAYPCNTVADILIYNKNVFDHFGVPYPEGLLTWDEFAQIARQVNSATNPVPAAGRKIYAVANLGWRNFFEGLRGEFFDENGLPVLAGSPELAQAFQMHKDFVFRERIMLTSVDLRALSGQGGWGSGWMNQFAAGRFAMVVTGEWAIIGLGRAHRQQSEALAARGIRPDDATDPLDRPLRLGAVRVPRFAGRPPSYLVKSRMAGINANSPNREAALAFLQFLAGREYSELINASADALPGNPRYVDAGLAEGEPDLARLQLRETTVEAMRDGFTPRQSPFLLTSDVVRVLEAQISRMESDPSLEVASLLRAAQAEVDALLFRNLDRDPDLHRRHRAATVLRAAADTPK